MSCPAKHEDQHCRLDANHATHVAGFGKQMIEWPNEDYVPPPPRTSLRRMAEIAESLRRADAVGTVTNPSKG